MKMEQLNSGTEGSFRAGQDRYFSEADSARFFWQTRHSFVSPLEREILPKMNTAQIENFLEIGCGEGANLALMSPLPPVTIGVDLYLRKIQFAKTQVPAAHFVASDAVSLPFADRFFDCILLRDLLHHVVNPRNVLREASRILKPEGRLVIIETNGKNLLTKLFAFRVPEERKVLQNDPASVLNLLDGILKIRRPELQMAHPFPLHRALLHYRFGFPWLTQLPLIPLLLKLMNWLASKTLPQRLWYYIIIECKAN